MLGEHTKGLSSQGSGVRDSDVHMENWGACERLLGTTGRGHLCRVAGHYLGRGEQPRNDIAELLMPFKPYQGFYTKCRKPLNSFKQESKQYLWFIEASLSGVYSMIGREVGWSGPGGSEMLEIHYSEKCWWLALWWWRRGW